MPEDLERQLARLRHGDHLCSLYSTIEEELAVCVPFMVHGIARGECCICVCAERDVEPISQALSSAGVDLKAVCERKALEFWNVRESYLRTEEFDPNGMIDFIGRCEEKARAEAFAGLRWVGQMIWALEAGIDPQKLLEYEAKLNQYLPGSSAIALCQYDKSLFSPAIIHEVIITHPVIVIGDLVCPNPYYEPPELVLAFGDNASDERKSLRTQWWINQLTRARAAELERERVEEENKRAERELRRLAERLHGLSRQLLRVQEEERRHLARELHDEVGQLLTGLRLLLRPREQLEPDSVRDRFEQARSVVDDLLERVRGLSFDLRPAALDQLGLVPGLLALFERYSHQSGILVDFKHQGLDQRFTPDVETAAYRIVQEALTNVARHAAVAGVTVRLWASDEVLHVQVEDRGRGFDAEVALQSPHSRGLTGMNERVGLLGGRLTVESRPRCGTQVLAEIPLRLPEEER